MPEIPLRLVLDTNVLLSGVVSISSASRKILDALTARVAVPLISPPIMAEYREVLYDRDILARFEDLTPKRIEMVLHRFHYVAEEFRTRKVKFVFDRDPDDAMFIELAIAGSASHIVTLDADLLSLPTAHSDAGKRFRQRLRQTTILNPYEFWNQYEALLRTRQS